MRFLWIAAICLAGSALAFTQTDGSEAASRDDVILYLRTMHSHDLMRKTLEVQSKSMQQMFHDQFLKDQGKLPPDFEAHFNKLTDDLMKGVPIDDLTQAMIPAYQKHFTKADIEAMNAFYSSPVGQKVLEELPAVMQESMQATMPMLSKYLSAWKQRMTQEFKEMEKSGPKKEQSSTSQQ